MEDRIELCSDTLEFIGRQIQNLENRVNLTEDHDELYILLDELRCWRKKCQYEGKIIEGLKLEQKQVMGEDWKE